MKTRTAFVTALSSLLATSPLTANEPQSVTIRGQRFDVWPTEDLTRRGFDVAPVPQTENAAWVYLEASNTYVELPETLEDAFEYAADVTWPRGHTGLEDYLRLPANRRAIELTCQAAAMKGYQMPYFGDRTDSILGMVLPNLSHMRFLAKLMIVDARHLEVQDQYDQAVNLYVNVMRMGAHAGQGVTLIEGLVGIAIWRTGEQAALDMALRRPLSHRQLNTLLAELNKLAPQLPTVDRGLQSERSMGPAVVDELCSRPVKFFANLRLGANDDDMPFVPEGFGSDPEDGWGRLALRVGRLVYPDQAIKRHMLGYYDKVLEKAKKGPVGAAAMSFDEEQYIREVIPQWDVLSRSLLPSLLRVVTIGQRLKTEFAVTRAMLAVRIYMLEHFGRLPETLNEVKEELPDDALIDPFSDDLLVYRSSEDGFLLYSLGPNLIDDGGQQGERWDQLDMVCKFPPEAIRPFDIHGDEQ